MSPLIALSLILYPPQNILRVLRVVRVIRLIPGLRILQRGLALASDALPTIGSIMVVMVIVMFVYVSN